MAANRPLGAMRPSLAFMLLAALFLALCLAGGASRGDVLGQPVVRGASWAVIIIALVALPRASAIGSRFIPGMLFLAVALSLLQLIPLPPVVWQHLPGRAIFADAVVASGQDQPWRPWSIVPGATMNAASSLIVPFAVWLLASHLPERERQWLPGLLLAIIAISTLAGLLQFSGAMINNPFINDSPGEVGGTFANRNHFALLLAMGCLLAPVWGLLGERTLRWRTPVAWGLVLLFLLAILANGSRAGLGLGLVALLLSLAMSHQSMRKAVARYPRWVLPAAMATIVGVAAIFVSVSVLADRAVSINRLFAVDQGQDMRGRGFPVVLEMVGQYFPFGTGLGSFDPMFRLHEPLALLKPTYFNHAHNEFLEIVLDAGLPGALLLLAALGWWAWNSARVWQQGSSRRRALPRLGSALLFLVILASIVDYPARTPMIMAIAVIAAIWLSGHSQETDMPALPRSP